VPDWRLARPSNATSISALKSHLSKLPGYTDTCQMSNQPDGSFAAQTRCNIGANHCLIYKSTSTTPHSISHPCILNIPKVYAIPKPLFTISSIASQHRRRSLPNPPLHRNLGASPTEQRHHPANVQPLRIVDPQLLPQLWGTPTSWSSLEGLEMG
jgi:hypothetical protein